jgi:predicted Zn-dependent protease
MKRASLVIALLLAFGAPAVIAKDEAPERGGVKVDKMSPLRNLVPEQRLESMASQQYLSLTQMAQQKGALASEQDPQLQRLRAIADRLIPHAKIWNDKAGVWKWEVNLIGSPQVNAFCMPGGKIAFFTGLLTRLKLTDDEVAIVMGHEIAHALREHGRERMAKSTLLQLGTALGSAIFKLNDLGQAAVGQGAQLWMLKFSRDDETEADLVGLDIVARAGFDPRAGITLWQKMGIINKKSPPQWLTTHPAGANRIAEIRKHLPEVMPLFARAKGVPASQLEPYRSNVKGLEPVR